MVQVNNKKAKPNTDERKSYVKPELVQVHLVAEQAVLALCKAGGGLTSRNDCIAAGGYLTCASSGTS
ncbi:MAG: hypothetical protein RQ728_07440 [Brevefilum sp.]|nr:hypothetical protein [Brevefilum sp.]